MAAYVLNEELKRAVVQVVNQHLNSFQPRPKRTRRVRRGGGGGGGGASGTFVCTLSSNIGASTPGGTMTAGTGTVYSIGEDGELTEVGTRDIFNPFTCTLPSAAAQYTCAKTFEGATDADDQFTIVGPDMMQVLYSLTGAAEKTTLSLPEGATSADDIQWLGEEC